MVPTQSIDGPEASASAYRKLQHILDALQANMQRVQRAQADIAKLSVHGAELVSIAHEINAIDVDRVVETAVTRIPAAFGARYAAVFLYDVDRDEMELARHSADAPAAERAHMERDTDSFAVMAAGRDKPLVMRDLAEFERRSDVRLKDTVLRPHLAGGGIVLPLLSGAGGRRPAVGVLVMAGIEAGAFSAEEAVAAAQAAELAAAALTTCYLLQDLRRLATTDGLTRLYNHNLLLELLLREIMRFRRYGGAFSLLVVDIDDFRRFNDQYGHAAGDRMLQAVAGAVHGNFRAGIDVTARHDGARFAVILPETDLAGAFAAAHRVRQAVECCVFEHHGVTLAVTASIGAAEHREGEDPKTLIDRACRAMAAAKAAGRNRVFVESGGKVKDHV